MKLELPDDHPIAEAIREITSDTCGRLFLNLVGLNRDGTLTRYLSLEVDSWSKTARPTPKLMFEAVLTDPVIRDEQIKAMLTWPEIP